jgi:hypothetical protein
MPKSATVPILLLVLLVAGCAGRRESWPEGVEKSLWVPKNAQIIERSHQGFYRISYSAHACYPAEAVIADMVTTMTAKGWRRLDYGPLNPTVPLSPKLGTWNRGLDRNYRLGYGWMEAWEDREGNLIDYRFEYHPTGPQGITTEDCLLQGWSYYTPEHLVRAILAKIKEIEPKSSGPAEGGH